MNILKIFLVCTSVLLFFSCRTFIGQDKVSIRIGMEKDSVFLLNDDIYDGLIYIDKNALSKYGSIEISVTKISGAVSEDYYLYAFQNGKLIYWGYPFEFNRSNDETIAAIGLYASDYLLKKE